MNDPYEVLGISRDATEEEINTAYRNLVKQYHPDKYVGNPLASLAAEKIAEINAAYDAIEDERKNKKNTGDASNAYGSYSGTGANPNSAYNNIRKLIQFGRYDEAEAMLNDITVRDAEWHYLMGVLMRRKGWYDMAYEHIKKACDLDPSNNEYRQAKDSMDFSGTGYRNMSDMGGYNGSCCDGCQALICADCCCEMCGGNLIPCIGCR